MREGGRVRKGIGVKEGNSRAGEQEAGGGRGKWRTVHTSVIRISTMVTTFSANKL